MYSRKGHHQEEDEEFSTNRDAAPSSNTTTNNISNSNNNNNAKDRKDSDKANAIRLKHSVTEQRRRSKINERFQILRDLITHSGQKQDTASFLGEVIQYVQYLQEKVQKYEGSCQSWNSEPTKLMPWRNSPWRVHSFVGHPQAMKNGSDQVPIFPGRLDEDNTAVPSNIQSSQLDRVELNAGTEAPGRAMDLQTDLANKAMAVLMPTQTTVPVPVQTDGAFSLGLPGGDSLAQSADCLNSTDPVNQREELMVEGGKISISDVYSQGLLNSLTQVLQTAGMDLSQATISLQINFGKKANTRVTSGVSTPKDRENPMPSGDQPRVCFHTPSNGEDLDPAHKRLKI